MITNQINEISVWLDQLEDEGVDVSLMRLLCTYNYLSNFSFFQFGSGYSFGNSGFGDGAYAYISPSLYGGGCNCPVVGEEWDLL